MEYNFSEIEKKWQKAWEENGVYTVSNESDKPHYYVLDMFPYPSGAGLHVGHPLGYIASDIYSRYKRLKGFNVLHPMGFDSYGLPAEQYAIQTGQHPEKTTFENIDRYIEQLKKIGFCYDWNREVRTCDPKFYKWTQWAFVQMFNSYFDPKTQKAQPISKLIAEFEANDPKWATMSEKEQQEKLMNYRIAYLADTKVNWCPKLGTVLANDEVSEGLSVRGGYPVEQRVMRQWCLRVSAYAGRLLEGLDRIDWTESLKETQRNWIGRSEGAEMQFAVKGQDAPFTIFTTRADTVFGVTFMVLAPESEYVQRVVTPEQKAEVDAYLARCKNRTERERIADRKVTGVFTGSYAINPLTQGEIPIYISDYVLAGYGTGAIMAVPAHDSRDYAFAKHFNLPIIPLIEGADVSEESFDAKEGKMINSGFLNGMEVKEAIQAMKEYITNTGIGRVKVNYRLRDAIFSRQRYWGEPFPVYYKDGMPYSLPEDKLPLELPEVKDFKPTADGRPPLGNAENWEYEGHPLELCTMPGFAGSSAYYLRYMDPHNEDTLVGKQANEYWRQVDLYLGGSEHATGHLIYSRFWNKFLYDLGLSLSIVGIDPSYTLGDIARQRQQTIAQLKADGLLDAQQLLPLPTLIRRIAVISSPNAAGYEDFKHQLEHSSYPFRLQLFPAVMQGEAAEKSILAALDEITNHQYDAVAIIRGGGATTDLSCFDRYELCAVCAQFELPILTGIGHTRDISVLDLVAHEALKTPTAVAEWLIHRMDTQMNRIADLVVRLQRTGERQLLIRRHRIELLEQRLAACNPEQIYRRGYSLITKNGKVIRSVHELQPGDIITTHLADGSKEAYVK